MQDSEQVFNVPRMVTAVLAVMVAIHVARQFIPENWDQWLILCLGIVPARYAGYAAELPGGHVAVLTSFVTHMLLHGNLVHLLFNAAWLLAFGGAIAKRVGGVRFLLFSTFSGAAGALLFLGLHPGVATIMIGASGAISGLMGATMRFLFNVQGGGGFRRLRENPQSVPLMPLSEALTDRRIILATAIWLLLNVLAVYGIGTEHAPGGIAWEAHVGGYLAGLLAFGPFDVQMRNDAKQTPTLN